MTSLPLPSMDDLVDAHFDYLCRFANRYFGSSDRTEEIVQETFLAAIEALPRFNGGCSPRTWLVSILRHKAMNLLRDSRKYDFIELDTVDVDPDQLLFNEAEHWRNETGPLLWGSPPDEVLKQKDFRDCLDSCLEKLPKRIRHIFVLREVEGFEREDIAEILDLSSSNVGVILHRARLALQHCLQINWFKNTGVRA